MSVPACQPLPHLGQAEVAGLQELHQVQNDLPGGSVGPSRELEPGGVTAGGQPPLSLQVDPPMLLPTNGLHMKLLSGFDLWPG